MTKVVSGASAEPNAALVNGACEQSPPSGLRSTGGHTPGPWRVRENPRNDGETCDLSICSDIFVLADLTCPQYSHQWPNACLIATAPDLLAQLQWAETVLKCWIEGSAQLDNLRATIANAVQS